MRDLFSQLDPDLRLLFHLGEKPLSRAHLGHVVAPRTDTETRPQAGADLVPQAAGRAVDGEELLLIGKHHFLGLWTVAQLEPVVEAADRLSHAPARTNRAERGQHACRGKTSQERLRSRRAAQADIGGLAASRLSLDVEPRPPAPNQFQLTQERRKLAGSVFPDDRGSVLENAPGLGIAALGPEVAQQTGAQGLGLADINQLLLVGEHPIDTRPPRALFPESGA